jgi:hypothetical protein
MSLFRLSGAVRRNPAVEAWFAGAVRLDREVDALLGDPDDALRRLARTWFERIRACGEDVCELVHDRCPMACVGDATFAYVNVFKAHVNVGFFYGALLDDPARLLEGAGKRMRHTKLRLTEPVNEVALSELIAAAYRDIRARLESEGA